MFNAHLIPKRLGNDENGEAGVGAVRGMTTQAKQCSWKAIWGKLENESTQVQRVPDGRALEFSFVPILSVLLLEEA